MSLSYIRRMFVYWQWNASDNNILVYNVQGGVCGVGVWMGVVSVPTTNREYQCTQNRATAIYQMGNLKKKKTQKNNIYAEHTRKNSTLSKWLPMCYCGRPPVSTVTMTLQ